MSLRRDALLRVQYASPMRTVVINTGTEILLGDVVNTHLAFIAREIFPLGLRIDRQIAVPDGPAIREAIAEALATSDLLFVTGGLGPTTDDITREATAKLLGLTLANDPEVATALRNRLLHRGWAVTERILRQAMVPQGGVVMPNENGSAPGLYISANLNPAIRSPHLFLLPGPPRELQPMFIESVLPILREIIPEKSAIECRIYRIAGMGESIVEEAIGEKILAIPGIELGYCARPGEVDLRVIGESALVERAEAIIQSALGGSIFSANKEELEQVLIRSLTERKETLATAESCTGGLLAHRLTNVPGSSAAFLAGFVTYANEAKTNALGVDAALMKKYGAISEEVARAMAEGARDRTGATHALATTGIAGPSGGSEEKPVGTVYIALASRRADTLVRRFNFWSDRETFKQLTAQAAFNLLRERLLDL
jgi:competence/damage-inducible protein CinA-like protein